MIIKNGLGVRCDGCGEEFYNTDDILEFSVNSDAYVSYAVCSIECKEELL